jgi:hypothetical protein
MHKRLENISITFNISISFHLILAQSNYDFDSLWELKIEKMQSNA